MSIQPCISDDHVPPKLSSTMPWIGSYVAKTSFACLTAMLIDVSSSLRSKRLWIPCNLFSLNSASLTILAVAMKMPLDIGTYMEVPTDELTKLCSTVLMCISVGYFMPSLGAMDDREIFTNLIALGILVITMITNICIQLGANAIKDLVNEHKNVAILMFVLLVFSILSAFSIGTTKTYLESRYMEVSKLEKEEKKQVEDLKLYVKKYLILAESRSPQFVMARSIYGVASSLVCLTAAICLAEAEIRLYQASIGPQFVRTRSDYKWSTVFIVGIQSIAVYVGGIAMSLRWFTAVKLNFPKNGIKSYEVSKVEDYWIERLVEWKVSPLPLQIRGPKIKKFLEFMKRTFLQFVIMVQIVNVVACKLTSLLSICVLRMFFKKHVHHSGFSSNQGEAIETVTPPHEQDHY